MTVEEAEIKFVAYATGLMNGSAPITPAIQRSIDSQWTRECWAIEKSDLGIDGWMEILARSFDDWISVLYNDNVTEWVTEITKLAEGVYFKVPFTNDLSSTDMLYFVSVSELEKIANHVGTESEKSE